MLPELISAFLLIFVAEMGDKSQILAMAFASKYKLKHVLVGLFIGISLNHILAVLLGSFLDVLIPLELLSIIAGVLFVVFGLWSLLLSDDITNLKINKYGPIITVSIAFFIGELGDKTQLTAIALAADATYPLFILFGTILGMMFTSIIGIYIGVKFGKKLDEFYIKTGSSIIFIVFGFVKLLSVLDSTYLELYFIIPSVLIVVGIYAYLYIPLLKSHRSATLSVYQLTAERLRNYYSDISKRLEGICLGENHCGTCGENSCLVGYTKNVVKKAKNDEEIDFSFLRGNESKRFDQDKIIESLFITINSIENWKSNDYKYIHIIRENLEYLLFGSVIKYSNYNDYKKQIKKLNESIYNKLFQS